MTPTPQHARASDPQPQISGRDCQQILFSTEYLKYIKFSFDDQNLSALSFLQADTAGPRVSSGVRQSLDNLTRSSSVHTPEEQRCAHFDLVNIVNIAKYVLIILISPLQV